MKSPVYFLIWIGRRWYNARLHRAGHSIARLKFKGLYELQTSQDSFRLLLHSPLPLQIKQWIEHARDFRLLGLILKPIHLGVNVSNSQRRTHTMRLTVERA